MDDPVLTTALRLLRRRTLCGCGLPSRLGAGRRSRSRGVWGSVLLHCGCGGGVVSVVRMRTAGGRVWAAVEQLPARRPEPVAVAFVPEDAEPFGWSP